MSPHAANDGRRASLLGAKTRPAPHDPCPHPRHDAGTGHTQHPRGVTDCTTPGGANRPPGGCRPRRPLRPPHPRGARQHDDETAPRARRAPRPAHLAPDDQRPRRHPAATHPHRTHPTDSQRQHVPTAATARRANTAPQRTARPRPTPWAPAAVRATTSTQPTRGTTGDTTPDPDASTVTPGGDPLPGVASRPERCCGFRRVRVPGDPRGGHFSGPQGRRPAARGHP